tara:strand:+ start:243 stop:515 length:273 start_codon:yes stop_codon:yes gene_type:complete
MNIQEIQKWITNAKTNESIIYHTGHLIEDIVYDKDKIETKKKANIFMEAAQQEKIDLFQKKIKKGDQSNKPIYEYIARKLKSHEKSNNKQ